MSFIAALQFLTIIPIKIERDPTQAGRATAWFPLVGLIIGMILAATNLVLSLFLPPAAVNSLVIVMLVVVTGAMHMDGLADTCDGLGGHKTPKERWQVMKDSRTGAFGVAGIVLLLLLKYVALSNIPVDWMLPTLLFMPTISRWAMVYAIFTFPNARSEGLGATYKTATRWPQFTIATVLTFLLATAGLFPFFLLNGTFIMVIVWIITMLVSLYLKHKFGGLTGDTYGAINEVAEVTALLFIIILATFGIGYGW